MRAAGNGLFIVGWFLMAAAEATPTGAQQPSMVPFPMPWRGGAAAEVDLSGLLDSPAGKDGFVTIRDGHFRTASGRRLRIWGVNLTGAACFPSRADAPAVAAHLARFGVNCVRFHFLDSNWGPDASLFPPGTDTTDRFDPAQLDRLDWFIFQLKRHGIYANINLNVGRVYRSGDGVADAGRLGLAKALQYFDDRIAELHRRYARRLLTHRNPYTKAEYRGEPAVLLVELVNENSLVESWFSGRLLGRRTTARAGTWCDITPHYGRLLTEKFNAWLARRYGPEKLAAWRKWAGVGPGEAIPRLEPKQFAAAGAERFAAEASFYMELESAYFQDMRNLLGKLGVRAAVVATSDHNHWKTGYPLVSSTSRLDVVDGHVYWQHPRYIRDASGRTRGFRIPNTPMVNDPLNSTVVQLARTPVAGKPYTVSEVNHPFPAEWACEGIPILAAYALLGDWDGIFWYTFEHADPAEWDTRRCGHFDIRPDPVKMTQLAACAAMFLRGDVAAARRTVLRTYSRSQVIETLRMSSAERPFFTPGFCRAIPLIHATRVAGFDGEPTRYAKTDVPEPIVSDTGQLSWSRGGGKGTVRIGTERTEALVGFVGGARRTLRNLLVEVRPQFCAVILTSLDGKPLAKSERMLLAVGARTATTGMKWDEKRQTLTDWGRPPMLIEPVTGRVVLRGRDANDPLVIVPLDGAGAARGPARPAKATDAGAEFRLDAPTCWYVIRRPRGR